MNWATAAGSKAGNECVHRGSWLNARRAIWSVLLNKTIGAKPNQQWSRIPHG